MSTDDEFDAMNEDEGLSHIGIARKSGRYPWGSGANPQQRSRDFKHYMDEMRQKGMTHTQIANALTEYANRGVTDPKDMVTIKSPDLRAAISSSTEYIRNENVARATQLKEDKQMSNVAIAKLMGTGEATVRGWLKQSDEVKEGSLRATSDVLKQHLETKPYLDVGKGTELYMGISDTRLRNSLAQLRDEGYKVYSLQTPQLGTDKLTRLRVLTKPGVTWHEARAAMLRGEIDNVTSYSEDGGLNFRTPKAQPVSVNLKRVDVRYADDGGHKMDGVIELRRGVEDLSLDNSRYAQVRVAVDGTHYLKGMAMYADDLPDGVDIRFNTNKTKAEAPNKVDAMKPLKTSKEGDPLPAQQAFGATVRPRVYLDKKGNEKTSPLNIVNEEGSWDDWSRSLSSQMLSKQPLALASQQLSETQSRRKAELEKIRSLTNPIVRQKMLDEFADSADAAAVHLKAAAMPRQSSHVILPINTMRPNEIYAPNFDNGDRVVLVRYPHGGPFEIPALTVNNKNRTAQRILSNARDAVGIHHSVAEQLSGADFDGDSVLVIHNPDGKVKSRPPLKELETFNPRARYKIPDDDTVTPRMTKKNTQTEMGKISNLITDMTIHGAPDSDLARAVKHSMVVIDAEKHGLNYKQSERDNGIAQLKTDYQGGARKGASTLISRASRSDSVPERKAISGKAGIDPKTGERLYRETGATYPAKAKVNARTGEVVEQPPIRKVTKGTEMEFTKDARTLSSGTPMEELYASHANTMKALANQARKDSVAIVSPRQSKAAKAMYRDEVASLKNKLQVAQRNAPVERRAQIIGNALARDRIDGHPEYDRDDIKKIKYQSLDEARQITEANKLKIGAPGTPSDITPREWEAIQSGAISSTTLKEILANADMGRIRELATPSGRISLTPGQMARAKQMQDSGRPMSEISATLGIPRSTIIDNINQ